MAIAVRSLASPQITRRHAVASAVAQRHGIHPNQLYGWRREQRPATAVATMPLPDFVPVSLLVATEKRGPVAVEITLGGVVVRAVPGVDLGFLSDVLHVVKAQR